MHVIGVFNRDSGTFKTTDMDAFAQTIPEKDRAAFFDNPERLQGVILNLLLKRQLASEARAAGLQNDDLVKAGIEIESEEVLARTRMKQFEADLKIPDLDELAHEQYTAHKEQYVTPGKLEVKQILVSSRLRSEDDAKARAESVAAEAAAHPEQFDALIEKYSDDPAKATGHGLIPDAGSGRNAPAFAKAAKELKAPGSISPAFRIPGGYAVIKLVTRTPDHQQSFQEARAQIIGQLRNDYVSKQVKNHTDALRNEPLDANPELVASLRTRYQKAPEQATKAAAHP